MCPACGHAIHAGRCEVLILAGIGRCFCAHRHKEDSHGTDRPASAGQLGRPVAGLGTVARSATLGEAVAALEREAKALGAASREMLSPGQMMRVFLDAHAEHMAQCARGAGDGAST